ncbi:MAG TPA: LamG domain-containing protein [Polyangium sp.]|nr:LamG domain-containing protein [Polyangium sp.]
MNWFPLVDCPRPRRLSAVAPPPVLPHGLVPPAAQGAKFSKAMRFNGTTDGIVTPAFAQPTAAITISVWARSATPAWNAEEVLVNLADARLGSVGTSMRFNIFSGSWQNCAATVSDIQNWHCYTATYDGAKLSLYVDGVLSTYSSWTGPIKADTWNVRIGTSWNDMLYFNGDMADAQVWNRALSADEVKANMHKKLTGKESGLVGYWPLSADAQDLSPNKYHGAIKGKPQIVSTGSTHVIGQGLRGEISEVQIWEQSQSAAEIKATMNLPRTGKEYGLGAYYRMGGILQDQSPPVVPDFSMNGRDGVVIGDPYAGARRLNRQTGSSNLAVVKYASSELVAVSARGVYEETFEFKIASTTPINPNSVNGGKLFTFRYWGKSGRGSRSIIEFPTASVTQSDFSEQPVGSGWYLAKCRVVVPDGVALMRAFELANVQGDFTAIDIRRHTIRQVSDAVTRRAFTDAPALTSLAAQSQAVVDLVDTVRTAEVAVGQREREVAECLAKLDVANNKAMYIAERDGLLRTIPTLEADLRTTQTALETLLNDPYSYYQRIRMRGTTQCIADEYDSAYGFPEDPTSTKQLWIVTRTGENDNVTISNYDATRFLTTWVAVHKDPAYTQLCHIILMKGSENRIDIVLGPNDNNIYAKRWVVEYPGGCVAPSTYMNDLEPAWIEDTVMSWYENRGVQHLRRSWGCANTFFDWIKTDIVVDRAKTNKTTYENRIAFLARDIPLKKNRLAWLEVAIAAAGDVTTVQNALANARTALSAARLTLNTANTNFRNGLTGVTSGPSAVMPVVSTDARNLVTTGAVLDFAQPASRVRLTESCEGNVLLTYVDKQNRIRATPYDAVADSRNSAFEQWVPDGVRACVDLRDEGDKITLDSAIELPPAWTLEAWVQLPAATATDGTARAYNMIAAADGKLEAVLALRNGTRLGMLVGDWFFPCDRDIPDRVALGWTHVAAKYDQGMATFYADGENLGSRHASQSALRFNNLCVNSPYFPNPSTVTLSVWMRSSTPTWGGTGTSVKAVEKNSSFWLSCVPGSRTVSFEFWTSGVRSVQFTPADIQGWHQYTGVFDNTSIKLYIDGRLVATADTSPPTQLFDFGVTIGSNSFRGDIAEVVVWNCTRTPNEIRQDVFQSPKGDEPNLAAYWRMELVTENGVAKVYDLSTNKRHCTTNGGQATDVSIRPWNRTSIKFLGNASTGTYPIGRMADVRLWNVALSDAEIEVNARTQVTGYEPGLVGYWPLNEAQGTVVKDLSASSSPVHGTLSAVDWVAFTGYIGRFGGPIDSMLTFDRASSSYLEAQNVVLGGKNFTIECWVRRSGAKVNTAAIEGLVSMRVATTTTTSMSTTTISPYAFFLGFNASGNLELWGRADSALDTAAFTAGVNNTKATSQGTYLDTNWHHVALTYDASTMKLSAYLDGLPALQCVTNIRSADTGTVTFFRQAGVADTFFRGDLAEVRIWEGARTVAQINENMGRRMAGSEYDLLAYYQLDAITTTSTGTKEVTDKKSGLNRGKLLSATTVSVSKSTVDPPLGAPPELIMAEYSATEMTPERTMQVLMRRFYGYAHGMGVRLLPEQRVEELTVQWVGNTQINPTLLGYIEGAPPVPSENLTVEQDDGLNEGYNEATTVTLTQSSDVTYTYRRSEQSWKTFDLEAFLGAAWEVTVGVAVEETISEGEVGGQLKYGSRSGTTNESTVSAWSSLTSIDSLTLRGRFEDRMACPRVGKRWLPKNVGYALVLSGMADVFVTKLKRSGRMVSYDVRPIEGVPLDVNTITFMINPAYTLNGSLDGMVGSVPADPTFYGHVPAQRAQYGALFPASYMRLKDAYALKNEINRQDKTREAYFNNTQSLSFTLDSADLAGSSQEFSDDEDDFADQATEVYGQLESKHGSMNGAIRAKAAFDTWQRGREAAQLEGGKRNIVNTYVWDGDGGLHVEEESFAGTLEHAFTVESTHEGAGGMAGTVQLSALKASLSILGGGGKTRASGQTLTSSKSLSLNVDLSGVERRFITNRSDQPLYPGEKVDRYRFMTFYLENDAQHFVDFFNYVVDPEWLMSNDEEARALRQTQAGRPNRCWRVLHRVTYVERPALK